MEPITATISYWLDTVVQLIKRIGHRKQRHHLILKNYNGYLTLLLKYVIKKKCFFVVKWHCKDRPIMHFMVFIFLMAFKKVRCEITRTYFVEKSGPDLHSNICCLPWSSHFCIYVHLLIFRDFRVCAKEI